MIILGKPTKTTLAHTESELSLSPSKDLLIHTKAVGKQKPPAACPNSIINIKGAYLHAPNVSGSAISPYKGKSNVTREFTKQPQTKHDKKPIRLVSQG